MSVELADVRNYKFFPERFDLNAFQLVDVISQCSASQQHYIARRKHVVTNGSFFDDIMTLRHHQSLVESLFLEL